MCADFPAKKRTLTFLAQIFPEMNFCLKILKTNVRIRISILEIPCVSIFRQNKQLWLFGPKFAQKWILGSEFQKSKSGFGTSTSKIPCVPIFIQNGQLWIFRPKFGEIAQLHAIFWFEYCWGCCRGVLLNCAPSSTRLHPPPSSSFQPPPSSIYLDLAHFSVHTALRNTLNVIKAEISHVDGQFPQI